MKKPNRSSPCNGNCMFGECDCEDSMLSRCLLAAQWALGILCVMLASLALGLIVGLQ
jgi:hypothetical protein